MDITNGNVKFEKRKTEMLGYPSENFKHYRDFMALVHPEDSDVAMNAMQRHIDGLADKYEVEYRILTKSGGYKWFYDIGAIIKKDPKGLPLYATGLVIDITERKRAEQSLINSEAALKKAQRVAHVGSWAWHTADNRLEWSDEMYRIFGIEKESFTGLLSDAINLAIHPDDRAAVEAANQLVTQEQSPIPMEYRVVWSDGTVRTVWAEAGELVLNDKGQAEVLTGIVQDITERKQAEDQLQESERKLKLFVEYAPAAIAMFDRDMKYIAASRRFLADYNLKDENIIGRSHYEIFPEISERWKEIHRRCLAGAIEKEEEDPFPRMDGTLDWVRWEIHPWNDRSGEIGGIILFSEVITERKLAEKQVQLQLQRMSALREIDRAISSSLDMRLSLDTVLNQVLPQLGVDAASVLLLNPSSQTLEYVVGKGFRTQNIRQSSMQLGEGFAGRVGLERKVLHIPDLGAMGSQFHRRDLLKEEKFVEYFGIPLVAKGTLKGVLEIFHRTPLDPDLEWLNYLETLGGQAAIAIDNVQLFEGIQQSNRELVTAYDATIAGWSHAMDLRDKETEGHTLRVTELTVRLAKKLGIHQQEIVQMRRGALLHDIGKLGVPDHILLKPGKLDQLEWAIMRQHPSYAYKMLLPITYLRPALDIPYCHHEKWDGSGYPRGLAGEEIPIAARLFAVIDVWDALRSDRPYRAGWTIEKTREHIIEGSGKHFDPQVVEAFLSLLDESPDLR
jgi:PAS domain S-box-containing protein